MSKVFKRQTIGNVKDRAEIQNIIKVKLRFVFYPGVTIPLF